jgi:uncharacterized membrane protein YkgB
MWDMIVGWVSNSTVDGVVLGVVELTMRVWPTAKPWSLLVPAQKIILGVASVLTTLSTTILAPLITVANNTTGPVLPQVKK